MKSQLSVQNIFKKMISEKESSKLVVVFAYLVVSIGFVVHGYMNRNVPAPTISGENIPASVTIVSKRALQACIDQDYPRLENVFFEQNGSIPETLPGVIRPLLPYCLGTTPRLVGYKWEETEKNEASGLPGTEYSLMYDVSTHEFPNAIAHIEILNLKGQKDIVLFYGFRIYPDFKLETVSQYYYIWEILSIIIAALAGYLYVKKSTKPNWVIFLIILLASFKLKNVFPFDLRVDLAWLFYVWYFTRGLCERIGRVNKKHD